MYLKKSLELIDVLIGFLSLEDAGISGNAGLKDQVYALRWIKQNIASFGGDPDNITLCGDSAGSACVNYHVISPMSEGNTYVNHQHRHLLSDAFSIFIDVTE